MPYLDRRTLWEGEREREGGREGGRARGREGGRGREGDREGERGRESLGEHGYAHCRAASTVMRIVGRRARLCALSSYPLVVTRLRRISIIHPAVTMRTVRSERGRRTLPVMNLVPTPSATMVPSTPAAAAAVAAAAAPPPPRRISESMAAVSPTRPPQWAAAPQ